MKNALLSLVLLFTVPSFAQTPPVDSNPLKAKMAGLGDLFVQIHQNISDPSQNQSSAAAAAQMVVLFTAALNLVPNTISALPADQQAAAIADYSDLIKKEITAATALQTAFLNNDNATAQTAFLQMNQGKRDGHTKFKPPAP